MVMKKFKDGLPGFISKRASTFRDNDSATGSADHPEANAIRAIKQFCESGGAADSGDEVLYLPAIVDSCESSPQAASAAAKQIRKLLSKENYSRPPVQYNAVMLIRILADNPGASFTRNIDTKFVDTVKDLLRNGRDNNVQMLVRETLTALESDKAYDTNMNPLFNMWRREATHPAAIAAQADRQQHLAGGGHRVLNAPAWTPNGPVPPSQVPGVGNDYGAQYASSRGHSHHHHRGMPTPEELVARVEEARTSAKLLLQLVQSTNPEDIQRNDLVKEFYQRCQSASRSIQNYINADNPPPDEDTMITLIETSEQLSLAMSKHSRAVLQARRLLGTASAVPSPPPQQGGVNNGAPSLAPAMSSGAAFSPSDFDVSSQSQSRATAGQQPQQQYQSQNPYSPPAAAAVAPPSHLTASLSRRDTPPITNIPSSDPDDPFSDPAIPNTTSSAPSMTTTNNNPYALPHSLQTQPPPSQPHQPPHTLAPGVALRRPVASPSSLPPPTTTNTTNTSSTAPTNPYAANAAYDDDTPDLYDSSPSHPTPYHNHPDASTYGGGGGGAAAAAAAYDPSAAYSASSGGLYDGARQLDTNESAATTTGMMNPQGRGRGSVEVVDASVGRPGRGAAGAPGEEWGLMDSTSSRGAMAAGEEEGSQGPVSPMEVKKVKYRF